MMVLLASVAIAAPADAADQLAYAPAPSWVVPLTLPVAPAASGSPVEILLFDHQVRLEPGESATYSRVAIRINAAEGLAAAGQSVMWDPAFDTAVVHKLVTRRGGKLIDLLAGPQKFTVMRREQELESQTLNGQLTAVIQPEGLQVGDIIEMEATVTRRDPTLRGHMEAAGGLSSPLAVQLASVRVLLPKGSRVREKRFAGLAAPSVTHIGGETEMRWSAAPLKPEIAPEDAPRRFASGARFELTAFDSWASMAALFEPLFDKAARLAPDSPLKAEVARIRAASNDPAVQAALALQLTQDKVRYVNLALGSGGLVPASADETWRRRFGDCKAKTALLIALLTELGIDATPVLVHSEAGDGLDQRLPLVGQFDHVLVRSVIGGKTYWLDGTRTGDTSLAALETPFYHWGLPLIANAALVPIMPAPLAQPASEEIFHTDARGGPDKPAPTRVELIYRGDSARALNTAVATLDPSIREAALKKPLQASLRAFTVTKASHSFDPATGTFTLSGEGTQMLELDNGAFWTRVPPPGFKADFRREATRDRDAPIAKDYPHYSRARQTILLPADRASRSRVLPSTLDETVAGTRYRRTVTNANGVITIDGSRQTLVPEIPYAEALAAEARLTALARNDIYIVLTDRDSVSGDQVKALLGKAPTSAADYWTAAIKFMEQGDAGKALAMFDRTLELDPRHKSALMSRASARMGMGDKAGAKADAAALLKLDPTNSEMLRISAELARQGGSIDETLKAADALAKVDNARAQIERANLLGEIGRTEQALAAIDRALSYEKDPLTYARRAALLPAERKADRLAALKAGVALGPRDWQALTELAKVALQLGEGGIALDLMNRAFLKQPDNLDIRNQRAIAMAAAGETRDSVREFEALGAKASAPVDLNNLCFAKAMAGVELDRALAECDRALAERDAPEFRDSRAWTLIRLKRFDEAIADFDKVLAAAELPSSYLGRAVAWARKGDTARSSADFQAAMRLSPGTVREFGQYGIKP